MSRTAFPWKMLAITASALVVLFVGGFIISGNQPVRSQQPIRAAKTAMLPAAETKPATTNKDKVTTPAKTATSNPVKNARLRFKHKPSPKKSKAASSTASTTTAVMDEGPTPLNEMLVMSMNAPKPAADADEAHPKKGWDNLEKYFSTEATAPDGKGGIVKVSFTVEPDGGLKDFKVQNSLNEVADKKAVELIKNGPTWSGNANKQPSEVSVSVNFH